VVVPTVRPASRAARHCGRTDQAPRTSLAGATPSACDRCDAGAPNQSRFDTPTRLHLARRWLDLSPGRGCDAPSTVNDRNAFAWSAAAAVRGDPEAQVLLGRCFAAGRGIAKNLDQAHKWFQRAAASGSSEALYRLRTLRIERRPWLRYRHSVIAWVGLAILGAHAMTRGVRIDPRGVLAYLGLSVLGLCLVLAWAALRRSTSRVAAPPRRTDPLGADAADHVPDSDYVFDRQVENWMRRPWRILWVATEDGAFLAPLVWLGVTPWTAALAGVAFGMAHYPSFSARACVLKGLEHAAIALLLLPWAGVWSIVVGHVLWDTALLGLGAWSRGRRPSAACTSPGQAGQAEAGS
jgi:hypothetical protein